MITTYFNFIFSYINLINEFNFKNITSFDHSFFFMINLHFFFKYKKYQKNKNELITLLESTYKLYNAIILG